LSEYTREEILKLIEDNDGPEGLDLSERDLSVLDLGRESICVEFKRSLANHPDVHPIWYYFGGGELEGINLAGVNLSGAHMADIHLSGAYLLGANLKDAYLERGVLEEADLTEANLQGAYLGNARCRKACLQGADLTGARLDNVDLREAYLMGVNFQGADLNHANLEEADLEETYLHAYMAGINLCRANLSRVNIGKVEMIGAKLQEADLSWARLIGTHLQNADFTKATLMEAVMNGTYLYGAILNKTRLTKVQFVDGVIGEERERRYRQAQEVYLALKNNFAEIGRYRDESWAYVKERQMGKMCSAPWRARRFYGESQLGDSKESRLPAWHPRVWWFYIRHTWKWSWDWIAEGTCKYGESIFRTLGTMSVALVGFAALYRLLGAVMEVNGNLSNGWLHCLLYSGGAFTTFGVDTLRPANDWIRALSIFESAVGIALTGLLGFVLGNRIRRS